MRILHNILKIQNPFVQKINFIRYKCLNDTRRKCNGRLFCEKSKSKSKSEIQIDHLLKSCFHMGGAFNLFRLSWKTGTGVPTPFKVAFCLR